MSATLGDQNSEWSAFGSIRVRRDCDPALRAVFENQGLVVVWARQSGRRARRVSNAVVRDLNEAQRLLRDRWGVDITDALPENNVLVQELTQSKDVVHSVDLDSGLPFTNTFVVKDLRPAAPIVLVLCAGPSDKIDMNRNQPAVVRLADIVRDVEPSLIYAKTFGRLFRESWGQAPFQIELRRLREAGHPVRIATGADGLWEEGPLAEANQLVKGQGHRSEAKGISANTRQAILTHTGTNPRMVDGWARYHVAGALPPGLSRFTMARTGEGGIRAKRVYLDCPEVYPDPSTVTGQFPAVLDQAGRPACQVKIIRWYLANAGRPEWSWQALAEELIRRGYSTDMLRSHYGPAATFAPNDPNRTMSIQRSILASLDVYETGRLSRNVYGVMVHLENVMPLDGKPWAQPSDFERIRAGLATRRAQAERRVFTTFSRLPCTFEGEARVLRPSEGLAHKWAGQYQSTDLRYGFIRPLDNRRTKGDHSRPAPDASLLWRPQVWLKHEWLAASILEAITQCTINPTPPATLPDHDSEREALQGALAKARQRLADKTRERHALTARACEIIPGTVDRYVLPPTTRRQTWEQIETLKKEESELDQTIDELRNRLVAREESLWRLYRGLEVTRLFDLLASLRDPHNVTYRRMWFDAIHDLRITLTRVWSNGLPGRELTWSFTLRVSDNDKRVDVPVQGTAMFGAVADGNYRAERHISQMRQGFPIWPRRNAISQFDLIATALEGAPAPNGLLYCKDGPLIKLAMAVVYPEGRRPGRVTLMGDEELVAQFRRPDKLATRLRSLWGDPQNRPRQWLSVPNYTEAAALVAAAKNHGLVAPPQPRRLTSRLNSMLPGRKASEPSAYGVWSKRDGVWRVTPCQHCGSHARARSKLREVFGLICLICRLDDRGVLWDAVQYDQYLAYPSLWEAAGFAVRPADEPPPRPTNSWIARRTRPLVDLDEGELAELRRLYEGEHLDLRKAAVRLGVTTNHAREYFHSLGILRKPGRPPGIRA